ncbi:conserved hypothetical protein [Talaromyces stipitatus ATCC 10500]|uniref:CENP-V/GFA domain-containing protein n=1 Tax=Talaromyces stipitatus (strain ATCC 10500 / CBS 375.48 / QM 6759 / NRRL 1006) TaxID=441959 RepID=B8LWM8_TALSN|nr:uncharacterized protein TSTA_077840 [Talaromyces stipitatus ATCC 10500]EED24425.1 conserved hypothetical protein [Talaromyces stipitatus ATCC 10500]
MVPISSIQFTCLCGSISEPGSLLSDQNTPVYAEMCSMCSVLTTHFIAVTKTLNSLQPYKNSDVATRYFCPACGCFCVFYTAPLDTWYFISRAIEHNPAIKLDVPGEPNNIFMVMRYAHILDTKDGGLAPFLLQLGDRAAPTWAGIPEPISAPQNSYDLPHTNILSMISASPENYTQQPDKDSYPTASCHCGGVALLIQCANHTAKDSSCHNYSDPAKYPTYLCACRFCRLSTGISLFPWTPVNAGNVFNMKKTSVSPDNTTPDSLIPATFSFAASSSNSNPELSLKYYWSSPNTCRSFCANCGATTSYWCAQRPDELDIAVGILRSEDGSLARKLLGWEWGRLLT